MALPCVGITMGPPLSGSHHSSSLGAIPFNIWDVRLCPPQVYCLVALATLSTRKNHHDFPFDLRDVAVIFSLPYQATMAPSLAR